MTKTAHTNSRTTILPPPTATAQRRASLSYKVAPVSARRMASAERAADRFDALCVEIERERRKRVERQRVAAALIACTPTVPAPASAGTPTVPVMVAV